MRPCDKPLPLPTCTECLRPRRGSDAKCVCGFMWPQPQPLQLDDYTRALGLREVAKARKQLRVARALRQLDSSAA